MEELKYPIGRFEYGKTYSEEDIKNNIITLEQFPIRLREAANALNPELLKSTYRPKGWTALQVINHLSDSHTNAFIRLKWTLTEDTPIIKPYKEALWAELPDGKTMEAETSIQLLELIHRKWVFLLKTLSMKDFERKYIHPEYNREYTLAEYVALYVWHCNHHLGHLQIILNNR